GATIVDDTFSSSLESLDAALDVLSLWKGRRAVILGDPGQLTDEEINRIGERLALNLRAALVTVGSGADELGLSARIAGHMLERRAPAVTLTDAPEDAAAAVEPLLGEDTVVLVKGGERARLERVVERLIAQPDRAPELLVRQDRGWKQRVFLSD